MIMAYCRAETPLYGHIFSGGGFSGGDGSKEANIIGVEGEQRWGGGGELNGIFLQFEFVLEWIRPYTRFAKFLHNSFDKCKISCKVLHDAQNKIKWKKIYLNVISY